MEPQTVAQAVQAATQQQAAQQAAAQAQIASPGQSGQASTIDNLTCQWQGCGERCDSAEALYDHVCERHVGRKSTNNLNLTCQWGACRTTTVKRDHITSHIRVHVPLKPHKCDFCGKAFKRPQDLKKHVKTHADDSVLINSPQPGANNRGAGNTGLGQQNGKTNYYAGPDGSMTNPYPTYQPNMGGNANGNIYAQQNNGQYGGYGSVSYPNNSMADIQSMDTRKRAIEALNDFLGDIKRRAINPNSYYDVGSRLQTNSLPLPVASGNGYNMGYNTQSSYGGFNTQSLLEAFNHAGDMGGSGGVHGPLSQGYSLPLPNARTKDDLQEIDRFLEQLQTTVYEASGSAAAAGIQQPGVHAQFTGDFNLGSSHQNQYRSSNSPPSMPQSQGGMSSAAISSVGNMQGLTSSAGAIDTPALTPASVSSYSSSAHSPMSTGERSSMGGNNMYPSLPSVTGISDLGSGYPTTTSAPASGLASGFEGLDGRRYSGGRLQRQAPGQDTEMADPAEDGARTPKQADVRRPKSKGNSSIDPALRGEDEKSSSESAGTPAAVSATEGDDKRQEEWVENIRVIEALRKWIGERLRNGEYDDSTEIEQHAMDTSGGADAKMVETAKMVEEKMADVEAEVRNMRNAEAAAAGDVKYPSLPGA